MAIQGIESLKLRECFVRFRLPRGIEQRVAQMISHDLEQGRMHWKYRDAKGDFISDNIERTLRRIDKPPVSVKNVDST